MKCPNCDTKMIVNMTRGTQDEPWVARHRKCKSCGTKFWTFELSADDLLKLKKTDSEESDKAPRGGA